MNEEPKTDFEKAGERYANQSLVAEFIHFLATNRKWWLVPIILVMLLMSAMAFISVWLGPAAAPFIYTLF